MIVHTNKLRLLLYKYRYPLRLFIELKNLGRCKTILLTLIRVFYLQFHVFTILTIWKYHLCVLKLENRNKIIFSFRIAALESIKLKEKNAAKAEPVKPKVEEKRPEFVITAHRSRTNLVSIIPQQEEVAQTLIPVQTLPLLTNLPLPYYSPHAPPPPFNPLVAPPPFRPASPPRTRRLNSPPSPVQHWRYRSRSRSYERRRSFSPIRRSPPRRRVGSPYRSPPRRWSPGRRSPPMRRSPMRRTPPGPRRSPFDGRKSPRRVDPTRPRSPRSAPHQRRLLFNINYATFKSFLQL